MTTTLQQQRAELKAAVTNNYNPSAFPGSAAWRRCNSAQIALEVFDAAHPEILAEIKAQQLAAREARLNSTYID